MALISRNLTLRLLVAVVFIPLLVYISLQGGLLLLILVEILLALSLWEFFALTKVSLYLWQKLLLILVALAFPYSTAHLQGQYLIELTIAAVIFAALPHTFTKSLGNIGRSMGLSLMALLYLTVGFGSLLLIPETGKLNTGDHGAGGEWLVFLFATLWIADTAAYFFGWKFGERKLSSAISPNKTVVGFIGGFIGALLSALLFNFILLAEVGFLRLIAPAVVIALFGQLGDLVESIFKREMGVKDSSGVIPGHGGVLDRFDSLVFAAPALYLYLKWIY